MNTKRMTSAVIGFSRHFVFTNNRSLLAALLNDEGQDAFAEAVTSGAVLSGEYKGDKETRVDVLFLYTENDPSVTAWPYAAFARNREGKLVLVRYGYGSRHIVSRASGWMLMLEDGGVYTRGDVLLDAQGSEHQIKDHYPVDGGGKRYRIVDHNGRVLDPEQLNCRPVNFSR